jgi:hypothetical protein
VPSIIRVWYYVDISGNGSNFSQRQFWQGLFQPPVNKFNPVWGANGYTALSVNLSEAWWLNGVWQIGAGSVGYRSDGQLWPTGVNVQYGRSLWHAKDIGPAWQIEQWWPFEHTYGLDSITTGFSGCY